MGVGVRRSFSPEVQGGTPDAKASGRKCEVKMAEKSSEDPGKTLTALERKLGVAA